MNRTFHGVGKTKSRIPDFAFDYMVTIDTQVLTLCFPRAYGISFTLDKDNNIFELSGELQ